MRANLVFLCACDILPVREIVGGIDLALGFSASLSALRNTIGSVDGAISSTVTAYGAVHYDWSHALDLAAVITIFSGLLFSFVDVSKSIEERSA